MLGRALTYLAPGLLMPTFPLFTLLCCFIIAGCSSTTQSKIVNKQSFETWWCSGALSQQSWICSNRGEYPQVPKAQQIISSEPETSLETPDPVVTKPANQLSAQAQIMAAPRHHYAIQLIAMADGKAVDAYAEQLQLKKPLRARLTSGGRLWHVLLAGIYPSRGTAQEAVDALQLSYPGLATWIRRVGGLQDAIANAEANPDNN